MMRKGGSLPRMLDVAEKEKRDMSAEERAQYDKIFGDARALGEKITRERRRNKIAEGCPSRRPCRSYGRAEAEGIQELACYRQRC